MKEITSEGKCIYCGKIFSKSVISMHLEKHFSEETDHSSSSAFHIRAEAGDCFLNILMDGSKNLKTLDSFLRAIWLECCGHLSAFRYGRNEIGMNRIVSDVFQPGLKLDYEYDFGSTTRLQIKIISAHSIQVKEGIKLLSRNEPLAYICTSCNKNPAEKTCIVHLDEDDGYYCSGCAKQHAKECDDFDDYAEMPLVNSPRAGECGYMEGTIDVERDGIFKARV